MGYIEMVIVIIGLVMKIFSEVLSARAKAKERKEAFEMDKSKFLDLANKILIKERAQLARESRDARSVEDQIRDDLNRK